jgi:hypothetical protein
VQVLLHLQPHMMQQQQQQQQQHYQLLVWLS